MAFSVTPTSGVAPYVINATFANRLGFERGLYRLEVRIPKTVGSCPLPNSGTNQALIAEQLLSTGSYSLTTSVEVGSCQSIGLRIVNVATSAVTSSQSEEISNL